MCRHIKELIAIKKVDAYGTETVHLTPLRRSLASSP